MAITSRSGWGARSPKRVNKATMGSPSTGHWNGPTITVRGSSKWNHSDCSSLLRGIQNFHMDARNWNDIAYNFAVCPHRVVFELRGLQVSNGANGTNVGNKSSHAILFLAGEGNEFNDEEKHAFVEAVNHISAHTPAPAKAIGHRDHKATACPGDSRYHWIHAGMPIIGDSKPAPSPPRPPQPADPNIVKLGDKGAPVEMIQAIIRDFGGGNIDVDGVFGPQTEARVKELQLFFGLDPDGIVGPNTWSLLEQIVAANEKVPDKDEGTNEKPKANYGNYPTIRKGLTRRGGSGGLVKYLQRVLNDKAGTNLTVDGDFGPSTEAEVKNFQRYFKLKTDGIVGQKTWAVIDQLALS